MVVASLLPNHNMFHESTRLNPGFSVAQTGRGRKGKPDHARFAPAEAKLTLLSLLRACFAAHVSSRIRTSCLRGPGFSVRSQPPLAFLAKQVLNRSQLTGSWILGLDPNLSGAA